MEVWALDWPGSGPPGRTNGTWWPSALSFRRVFGSFMEPNSLGGFSWQMSPGGLSWPQDVSRRREIWAVLHGQQTASSPCSQPIFLDIYSPDVTRAPLGIGFRGENPAMGRTHMDPLD